MADSSSGKHSAQQMPEKKASGSRTALKIVLSLLILCAIAGGSYWAWGTYQMQQASSQVSQPTLPDEEQAKEPVVELVNNPIDFATLQQQKPDAKAWLAVPDTFVNYPIMRSDSDDGFYLNHDSDGDYNISGSIFMERANSAAFTDFVTMVYGHNNGDNAMFASLHYFEDATFFNNHPIFYIYTPGHILTYTIVSAYQYDDRHVLNTFNLADQTVRTSYYASVMNPDSLVKNTRSTADTQLTANSKIVQLSTCMTSNVYDDRRYIVTGVLTNDQLTY